MSKLAEKMLLLSMKLEQHPNKFCRMLGKVLGIWPVWYAHKLEQKYLGKESTDETD